MASQDVKEELTSIFLKLFQKIEVMLWISFHQASTTLKQKPAKDMTEKKKKLQAKTTDEHRCNNLYGDIKWCCHYGK